MSSIRRDGWTYRGISVESRGVFKSKYGGLTYAGQCKDGYACGLGVATWSSGDKEYAEQGPNGQCDGRCLVRSADGATYYYLHERGKKKESAVVTADGDCEYNDEACAPDDPRLLALIAQVAPVEVRPAARAPTRHRPATQTPRNRPARFDPRRRSRRPWPRRCIPTPHAVAGRCATQPNHQSHCKARPRSDACTDRFAEVVTREAASCTLTTGAWCTPRARPGSSVAMPQSSTPPYRTLPLGAGFAVSPLRSV
jgi:hypothetical protein